LGYTATIDSMNATPESLIKTTITRPKSDYPPMLQQYIDYKERFSDCLIFFQVGDFYELFFDDAVTTAKAINLTLTSRDKSSENPIPMCGVPLSVADQYCERLVALGFSVAIISQVGPVTGKGMVARKLERIITPAVQILAGPQASSDVGFVASVFVRSDTDCAVALSVVQSGQILIRDGLTVSDLPTYLRQFSVSEVVLPVVVNGKSLDRRIGWVRNLELSVTNKNIKFRVAPSKVPTNISKVDGFSSLSPTAKIAVSMLSEYINEVTVEIGFEFKSIQTASDKGRVLIDPTTRLNLELIKNNRDGSERGTLFELLNHTQTSGGARKLRQEIVSPLADIQAIQQRLELVNIFVNSSNEVQLIQNILKTSPDIERIAARIELGSITPKELASLRDFLSELSNIQAILSDIKIDHLLDKKIVGNLSILEKFLNDTLVQEPPFILNEGGYMNPSFYPELQDLINVQENSKDWLSQLEAQERAKTNIPSLKVKYTSVFGFFIEVSNTHLNKIPDYYTRKQTTSNSERFITPELKEKESAILGADQKRIALEKKLYESVKQESIQYCEKLRLLYQQISNLDFLCSLASSSVQNRFVRPCVEDNSSLKIINGRHPQVASVLKESFIPNDCHLDENSVFTWIITGPNMGGKSTFLRQVALITILAHMGSFVPAQEATIGLVDRIFARLGASDNITEGESTFMVEMRETANLIQGATNKSLLIIDEIGRGTATRDGLALAQSILEWILIKLKSRTLFATHFHEITELETNYLKSLKNVSVGSVMTDGQLIFTHKIESGAATRSFGIEVAKRAGLPSGLLNRAEKLLQISLNAANQVGPDSNKQLGLFDNLSTNTKKEDIFESVDNSSVEKLNRLENFIKKIDPDLVSPREALNFLYDLQKELQ
jgi:DNA mismatch repair protein MutS